MTSTPWNKDGGAALEAALAAVREDVGEVREELFEPDRDDLESSDEFRAAVERLAERDLHRDLLIQLARHRDIWVSRVALAVLAGRTDLPADWPSYAIRRLRSAPWDHGWLFLRTLEGVEEPVIGRVLARLQHVQDRDVVELIAARMANGREVVTEETFRQHVQLSQVEAIEEMFEDFDHPIPQVRAAFDAWRAGTVDLEFLKSFARVWQRPFDSPPALLVGGRRELVEAVHEKLEAEPAQSLLLVGEHGVGKTAVVRAALERLPTGWLVFEASAASVNAGMTHVGQLEGRVEELAEKLRGQRSVWVFPSLDEALWAGRHTQSPTGVIDLLLPHLQAGELRIVAETSPTGYELILAQRPQVASAFRAYRVRPLGEQDSVAVARDSLEHHRLSVRASDQVIGEALELAQQFLPGAAPPGNVVRLLEATVETVAERGDEGIETADVLSTLARVSGLPLVLLDPSAPLDLERVRDFFDTRVLGQSDAVECLIERVALIKAGLTDPTRPLGVFLFVGPTGTGKTELAKTLAEFLFGSPHRMTRLDMSEYQTPESLERLISDTSIEPQGAPLVASVRKDPFSVVLLDEFEKAAEPIWDLFLQVFDDGRLTDTHGRTVDFRKCVIILTGNVGSAIQRGPGLGFARAEEPFRPATVERAVTKSFRPEFLNRIDRVVVFRPFDRIHARELLEKELAAAVQRRGLRRRPWAVEYDESALDFLTERGFSPELGARPLKRAVERYLLTPLARAIVDQAVPEGDQFLFVTAGNGKIEVSFVDPDADSGAPPDERVVTDHELDLRSLTLAPRADAAAAAFLIDELHRIEAAARGEAVHDRKQQAMRAMSDADFWEDDGRFAVLADVEYLDRFEAALRTAGKLADRLRQRRSRNGRGSGELAGLLASRLYVLDRALAGLAEEAPLDVFLRVRPVAGSDSAEGTAFAARLAEMYVTWGERRGMRLERLRSRERGQHLFAVSGLGAGTILSLEAGLHVLEVVGDEEDRERSVERLAVAVDVAPWRPAPDTGEAARAARAEAELADMSASTHVVRRYRPTPSPLVRDAVRGYRTGRLDRIFAGDFDVF